MTIERIAESASQTRKPVVFSGIQPSGYLTLGNYLGAIRNWVREQDTYSNIFSIVDMHAISVPQSPAELNSNITTLATVFLACGIDPSRSVMFVQADVDEHAVLAWILNCITPVGWLNRMTQFKMKSAKQREETSAGLFDYPVLMAADILMYRAQYVPVGEDQKQHLELARDIVQRFNGMFGEIFVLPEPLIGHLGGRIMSLTDPTSKMSKSEPEGAVGLLDPPELIRKKIMRAQTDSFRDIVFDTRRAGLYNLLTVYELLSGDERAVIVARFEGKGYGDLKRELADLVIESLTSIRARYDELAQDPTYVRSLLREGADTLRPQARTMVAIVKQAVGLGATGPKPA